MQALSEQTVLAVGTNAASEVLPRFARQLEDLRTQRAEIAIEVKRSLTRTLFSRS